MNKLILLILSICFFIINCSGKKNPDPDELTDNISYAEMLSMIPDSSELILTDQFYELENSVEDIKKEIKILQERVLDYKYKPIE